MTHYSEQREQLKLMVGLTVLSVDAPESGAGFVHIKFTDGSVSSIWQGDSLNQETITVTQSNGRISAEFKGLTSEGRYLLRSDYVRGIHAKPDYSDITDDEFDQMLLAVRNTWGFTDRTLVILDLPGMPESKKRYVHRFEKRTEVQPEKMTEAENLSNLIRMEKALAEQVRQIRDRRLKSEER